LSWRLYTIPNTNCELYSHGNSNAPGYAYWVAARDADAENCANSEASPYSNTAAVIFADEAKAHGSISLNCLDTFDALGVKDVYAPKRKQGESEDYLHD